MSQKDQKFLRREEARLRGQQPLPPVTPDVLGLGVGLLSDRADLAGMVGGLSQPTPPEAKIVCDHVHRDGDRHVFVFAEYPNQAFDAQALRVYVNRFAPQMSAEWCVTMDDTIELLNRLNKTSS